MSASRISLRVLGEADLTALLGAAVTDADPAEVMPPMPGPPGWTVDRRRTFCDFHRSRSVATTEPVETTYVIMLDDRVIGAARLQPSGDRVETGVWLGRSCRGQGIGRRVAAELLSLARETPAALVVASTTVDNLAAQRILRSIGATLATSDDTVNAVLMTGGPGG